MEQDFILPKVHDLALQSGSVHNGSAQSTSSELTLRPGEVLVRAGDTLRGCFLVKSGRLKRLRAYRAGEFLHGIAGPGDYLGLEDVIAGHSERHRETLEAIGETVVSTFSADQIATWCKSVPSDFSQLLRQRFDSFQTERFLSRPIDLLPVRSRVAATLWLLAVKHASLEGSSPIRTLDLNLTREEVAHLAGTVYESVIRTLTSLKKEGVLDLNGRVIRILNDVELARIGQIVISDTHGENSFV